MDISTEQIKQLAHLARLELSEAEVVQLSEQLPRIVEYVGKLQSVTTNDVPPETEVTTNLRSDIATPSTAGKMILEQAPEKNGQLWKVDAVFS